MNMVANAVQTTLKATVGETEKKPLPSVDTTPQLKEIATEKLNDDLLRKSYELADHAYDIQFGKDGIEELNQRLTGLQGKVGEVVFAIAKLAYSYCESIPNGHGLTIARQYFMKLCEYDEAHLVSRYVEDSAAKGNAQELPISKLIPTWSNYKSSIAKGMERGLDPMARDPKTATEKNPKGSLMWPTAANYRAKVAEMDALERGANERDTDKPADRKEKEAALTVITSGWVGPLKGAMEIMNKELNRLSHDDQLQFVESVLAIAGQAKTLADTRHREAAGDTRTPAQKATQPMTAEQLTTKLQSDRSDIEGDVGTQAALQAAVDSSAKGPQAPASAEDAPKGHRKAKRA